MRVKTTPAALLTQSAGRRESPSLSSLRWRAFCVSVCLLVYVPAVLLGAWAGVRLLPGAPDATSGFLSYDQQSLMRTALDVYGAVFFLTVIFFSLWVWRAAKTVRRMGIVVAVDTPGMAVWSFFLPVIWWWKPYAVVRALWQVAMDPDDWDNVAISQALPLWWTAWIAQWVAAIAGLGIETIVMGADKRYVEMTVIWVFAGFGIIGALSLLIVIMQTTRGLSRQLRNRQPVS
jgi:hypothetical protein